MHRARTTDEGRAGTRLGLASVKSVGQAHGGAVTVESAPGEGASLMDLPVRQ
jgi:two-component system sensor histidine kinase ChvG